MIIQRRLGRHSAEAVENGRKDVSFAVNSSDADVFHGAARLHGQR